MAVLGKTDQVGGGGIAIIDASGHRVRTITHPRSGQQDIDPSWSPDGRRVAFSRLVGTGWWIYVVDADGSHLRRVTSGKADWRPVWSPDGRWIAFQAFNGYLKVVHPGGTGMRTIPTGRGLASFPGWQSSGRIAYNRGEHVYTSRLNGTRRKRIVRGRDARWSPDRRTIVYTGNIGGVYTIPATGGTGRKLSNGFEADWAPDGRRIVFQRLGDTAAQDTIWIMNRNGSRRHRILTRAAEPAWRPAR